MPFRCCVPGCKGNYDTGPKVQCFSFPKDEDLKKKWINAIPRKDFQITNSTKVCSLHFDDSFFIRKSVYYDQKTGTKLEVPLKTPRLDPAAIPSVFLGCPSYLSKPDVAKRRENPSDRACRLECANLEKAFQESQRTFLDEENRNRLTCLNDLNMCLKSEKLPSIWTVIARPNCVLFLWITDEACPFIKVSVTVYENMSLSIYYMKAQVKTLSNCNVPDKIHDMRKLLDILQNLSTFEDRVDTGDVLSCADSVFQILEEKLCSEKKKVLKFLKEQIHLVAKKCCRYSSEFMVFSSLLYTISPHAYKFLRNSQNIVLPHPSTIRKICGAYKLSPQIEMQNFLSYMKQWIKYLKPHEKTVILMIDEIHLKSYFDYKGGNLSGYAFNSDEAATSAQVFMVQSLLSSFKEVAHILPVKTIKGPTLFTIIKKIIVGLEELGYRVVAVVTDNNALNRNAISNFVQPPEIKIVYPHPCDTTRPLFYIVDSVHLLKSIRNNWLNQRNPGCNFFYPKFCLETNSIDPDSIQTASMNTLRELYKLEANEILKYSYGLSLKALNPSSLERQNVKLVLQIFNPFVAQALLANSNPNKLNNAANTASFISNILRWWSIVNVKTPLKGQRHANIYEEPIHTLDGDPKIAFLDKFVDWLDQWQASNYDAGKLSKETLAALRSTTYSLIEFSRYCINELNFGYVLLGKVQTDQLEARFGQYRQLAGSQYHVSIRQVYECETKLRLQKSLPIMSAADFETITLVPEESDWQSYNIEIDDNDIESLSSEIPVLAYVAGYCAFGALKSLACGDCKNNLVMDRNVTQNYHHSLIEALDRGGLNFPKPAVITALMYTEATVKKLLQPANSHRFQHSTQQKQIVRKVTLENLPEFDDLDTCNNGHTPEHVMYIIVNIATNIILNNLCKQKNDSIQASKAATSKKRKLSVFAK